MSNKHIYHYVYLIVNYAGKYYIGKRSTYQLPEYDIGVKYFSQSTNKQFVNDQKKNTHKYRYAVIKQFDTPTDAVAFETYLHQMLDVEHDSKSINKVNQSSQFFDATGKVPAKDKDGNIHYVHTNDPRYISGELVHNHTDMIPVRDRQGNTTKIYKNDPRLLTGEYQHVNVGKVTVLKDDGTTGQVSKDDPKYLDGTYISVNYGKVAARDLDGNIVYVRTDDPKYLDGTYIGMHTGKMRVTNGTQNLIIDPDQLDEYLKKGYTHGLTKKFKGKRKWMNNGHNNAAVYEPDIQKYLDDGWVFGHIAPNKKVDTTGRVWVKNESISTCIDPSELDEYLKNGYTIGRIYKKQNLNKGLKAIHKNGEMRKVKPELVEDYLKDGWTLGFRPRNKDTT